MSRYREAINLLRKIQSQRDSGRVIAETYSWEESSLDKIEAVLAIPESEAEQAIRECDELAALLEQK